MTACPHCHRTKHATDQHVYNCSRRPSRDELIKLRTVQELTYKEIGAKYKVTKETATAWCKEIGLGEFKVKPKYRAASKQRIKQRKRRLYEALLDDPAKMFTTKRLSIIARCNVTRANIDLKSLASEGVVVKVGRIRWQLKSRGVRLRELAGWPPLESWRGELWENGR